jgi:tyrosinase
VAAPVRQSILRLSQADWDRVVNALNAMKKSGVYDGFTERHMDAMMAPTLMDGESASSTQRNAAHRGPVFLPWHRRALLDFEAEMRKVDQAQPLITLPFLPTHLLSANGANWRNSSVWSRVGGNGSSTQGYKITTGPFKDWVSRIYSFSANSFSSRPGLVRKFATSGNMPGQPSTVMSAYDVSKWNEFVSTSASYRRANEAVHNTVHNLIGGDMSAGTSPNDPLFWLHHANVDRLWSVWQARWGYNVYQPVSGGPPGHNLKDVMRFLLTPATPESVLDHRPFYTYGTP